MRILWLTPYLPWPVFGGGTRVFNLIKALAASCDIDLIASSDLPQHDNAVTQLRGLCRTVEVVQPAVAVRGSRRRLQLRALTSTRSSLYWTTRSAPMQERIDEALRRQEYDVVVLEQSFMGCYTLPLPNRPLVVLDQQNVESELLLRSSRRERSLVRRGYNLLEYVKFLPDERRICRSVDLLLATSRPDQEALQRWTGSQPPCVVIPNGVDSASFAVAKDDNADDQTVRLVFTGSMHYSPNVEAVLYFVAEIWPLVQAQAPHAVLEIVGGEPPAEVQCLDRLPNVRVTGYVPDIRPHIAGAQVVIVPLRIGGGTRLKIVEALAMGRAVVTTSLGCEGLEVEHGRHLMVADEPAAFAARVIELLRDPARRVALGRNGRRLVEEAYDWRAIGHHLEAVLRERVEQRMHVGHAGQRLTG